MNIQFILLCADYFPPFSHRITHFSTTKTDYGFGTASENMNKRVRDSAFTSLLRQEISYFDSHTVGSLTSQLSDDAALIHSFSGQPIRQLVMSLSSVLIGVIVSFIYMWPFALVALATLPFMGFGAEVSSEMRVSYSCIAKYASLLLLYVYTLTSLSFSIDGDENVHG